MAEAADPCVVDLTFNAADQSGFLHPDSIDQVLGYENSQNPCPQVLSNGMQNYAYPACLTLVQWAIDYLNAQLATGGQCNGVKSAVLQFGSGQTYDFSDENTGPSENATYVAIDVSGLADTAQNTRLMISGSWDGNGNPTTTLVFNNYVYGFFGRVSRCAAASCLSHLTIAGFVWQAKQDYNDANDVNGRTSATINGVTYENSQGSYVVNSYTPNNDGTGTGLATINIPPGSFPAPDMLFDSTRSNGRYLRVYDNSNPLDPVLDSDPANNQLPWGQIRGQWNGNPPTYCKGGQQLTSVYTCKPQSTDGQNWTFVVSAASKWPLPTNLPNGIICIKSKAPWSDPYRIDGRDGNGNNLAHDIVFDHIAWVTASRGLFVGADNVQVTNSFIIRLPPINGQAPCITNSAGGPQIGDITGVYHTSANFVSNLVTQATGDNTIAFFNDLTPASYNISTPPPASYSQILSSTFDSSFAPPVVLYKSPNVYFADPGSRSSNQAAAPSFANSGNSISHCVTHSSKSSLEFPFNNPSQYYIAEPLCGIEIK